MNIALLLILSIIGFLALYWVLIGQWRWNEMLRQAQEKVQQKENAKKETNK